MSCKICGRGNCCESFHSLEEQKQFEQDYEAVQERMKSHFRYKINRLTKEEIENVIYVPLDEVIDIIDSY